MTDERWPEGADYCEVCDDHGETVGMPLTVVPLLQGTVRICADCCEFYDEHIAPEQEAA